MKALIYGNKVVDVIDKIPQPYEVQWVDCPDDCEKGMIYQDGKFTMGASAALSERKFNALWKSIALQDSTELEALKVEIDNKGL